MVLRSLRRSLHGSDVELSKLAEYWHGCACIVSYAVMWFSILFHVLLFQTIEMNRHCFLLFMSVLGYVSARSPAGDLWSPKHQPLFM